MSDYVKAVDFSAKDALATGNPNKIIKGTEINDEYNAIATAISSKADLASPAFLGNPTATTQTTGNNSTRLATTAFVQQEISATEASVAITGGTISGVAITGGTITGLATDLAVADGGTGSSTLTLNNVLLGNGTSPVQVVAPGTDGNVLTSNGTTWVSEALPDLGIGTGQTWQTPARSANTTYTNSTSKPIMVIITVSYNASNNATTLVIDGVTISTTNGNTLGGFNTHPVTFIVPVNSTYRLNTNNGIGNWAELR